MSSIARAIVIAWLGVLAMTLSAPCAITIEKGVDNATVAPALKQYDVQKVVLHWEIIYRDFDNYGVDSYEITPTTFLFVRYSRRTDKVDSTWLIVQPAKGSTKLERTFMPLKSFSIDNPETYSAVHEIKRKR